ncbi:MAG: hypothetical protein HKN36_07030 [Hellea sp.]|nr:hypothetical protein [Hellea sp.]
MFDITIFAMLGFLFASYAVVGNDALQTLGTFINSNSRLHWFWLFLFAALILVFTFTYGWYINGGDPSWGRLANVKKYPEVNIEWYHTLPPLVLVIITRYGIPVSTSFMVLTVFATMGGMTSMLKKSLIGYGLAFAVGLLLYLILSKTLERYFKENDVSEKAPYGLATVMALIIGLIVYFVPPLINPELNYTSATIGKIIAVGVVVDITSYFMVQRFGKGMYWTILQWVTTGYLWGVWLIQDFANIFVFLPRQLTWVEGFAGLVVIVILLGYTFWNKGGPVQKILSSKTAVTDIRSATVIDFTYASLLFFFKEVSNIPMSTTFVFLGLIAGREYGFTLLDKAMSFNKASKHFVSDASKAYLGLMISINMAVGLPRLSQYLSDKPVDPIPQEYLVFIAVANFLIIPVAWYFQKRKKKRRMYFAGATLIAAALAFFVYMPG